MLVGPCDKLLKKHHLQVVPKKRPVHGLKSDGATWLGNTSRILKFHQKKRKMDSSANNSLHHSTKKDTKKKNRRYGSVALLQSPFFVNYITKPAGGRTLPDISVKD